ncbi:MAG: nicotinate-nucleotide adenylyltransferase [Duncaniella sp.]|nr:nicotinate-nucleotide adenylyltransferase [Duncaniella sp.]
MKIALLGGSFNPVHIGHMMLASYVKQFMGFDEVWLMLSPLNPLKVNTADIIPDIYRLKMLDVAIGNAQGLVVNDIELSMPRPSYTVNTMAYLTKKYPKHTFKLVIGADNWKIFSRWKDSERLLDDYGVMVYPRPGYPVGTVYDERVEVIHAPTVDISSTFIRKSLARGKDMSYFLPAGVFEYIKANKLYGFKA